MRKNKQTSTQEMRKDSSSVPNFLTSGRIHSVSEIEDILEPYKDCNGWLKNSKKVEYLNVPIAFDIETTSFYISPREKGGLMYEWTFGFNGHVFIGRTWDDLMELFERISDLLELSPNRRIICFVHNLAFEMAWIQHRFKWKNVFATDVRKPLYALTTSGIEFRCSYMLSGYSLKKLGDELTTYKVQKMVGDLDYSLIRHSGTPMTEKELKYCENDVRVVMAYIQERIEEDGNILKLPLTNTGYVRKYCRDACMYEGSHKKNTKKFFKYRNLMENLTLDPALLMKCVRAFQGGFTHANAFYSGCTLSNVASIDFSSSYPAVCITSDRFPMGPAQEVKITSPADFRKNVSLYFCMFDVHIVGLRSKIFFENYWSESRCWKLHNAVVNNGRLVSCDECFTTMTDIDWEIFSRCYSWDKFEVGNFTRWRRGYLPTDLVKSIVDLYQKKSTLKGVEGMETEYQRSKGMLNSTYGMMVTSVLMPETTYTEEKGWTQEAPDVLTACENYNKNIRRFLYYPWGIAVTCLARYNLWTGILQIGKNGDYVYSDTDSIKFLNYEKHLPYINAYNAAVEEKLRKACDFHKIDYELVSPVIKGKRKTIGLWDFEGIYDNFRTLGAKRYMVYKDGKVNITVSGVNKKTAVPYLLNLPDRQGPRSLQQIFEAFTDDLYIPEDFTGKNIHTYIDYAIDGNITDYLGNTAEYHEKSAVHLEKTDYSLSISEQYLRYIEGLRDEYE